MKEKMPLQIPWTLKKIVKEYYDQFYVHRFDNQNEIDQLLKRHNLPKHKHEETDDLNRLISIEEFESKINKLPKQKASDSDGFTGECYQNLRKNLYQFYTISFKQQREREQILTYSISPTLP